MKSITIVFFISTLVAQNSNIHRLGDIQKRDIDGMKMVYVSAGSFEMGSSRNGESIQAACGSGSEKY